MWVNGYFMAFAQCLENLPPPNRAVDYGILWRCKCPECGVNHGKQWHIETDLCKTCQDKRKEICTTETAEKQRTGTK